MSLALQPSLSIDFIDHLMSMNDIAVEATKFRLAKGMDSTTIAAQSNPLTFLGRLSIGSLHQQPTTQPSMEEPGFSL